MIDYAVSRTTRLSHYAGFASLAVVLGLIAMPWWATRAQIGTTTSFLAIVAMAQMWNLLAGFGGLVSIGQQAFIGLGSYVAVMVALRGGTSIYFAVPVAGLVSAVAAWAIAFLVFRLRAPTSRSGHGSSPSFSESCSRIRRASAAVRAYRSRPR